MFEGTGGCAHSGADVCLLVQAAHETKTPLSRMQRLVACIVVATLHTLFGDVLPDDERARLVSLLTPSETSLRQYSQGMVDSVRKSVCNETASPHYVVVMADHGPAGLTSRAYYCRRDGTLTSHLLGVDDGGNKKETQMRDVLESKVDAIWPDGRVLATISDKAGVAKLFEGSPRASRSTIFCDRHRIATMGGKVSVAFGEQSRGTQCVEELAFTCVAFVRTWCGGIGRCLLCGLCDTISSGVPGTITRSLRLSDSTLKTTGKDWAKPLRWNTQGQAVGC